MVGIRIHMRQRMTSVKSKERVDLRVSAHRRIHAQMWHCCLSMEQTAMKERDWALLGLEYEDPLCSTSSPLCTFKFTVIMFGLILFMLSYFPCLFSLSGATKVTACGRMLTSWSRMATGDPGQNLAPAHEPVELEFASERASATIQCRSSALVVVPVNW